MNDTLTNRQIAFILFGAIVGYGMMTLPKDVAESAGTGGWISLLMATLLAIIFTYIFTYIGYVHKNKTFFEYSEILTGKFITSLFMGIYIVYFFFIFTMVTRISSETIRLTLLIKTPVWALCFVFYFVVYYAVTKKLRVIGRICELYGVIIIFMALVIYFLIFTQGKLINLRPFFGSGHIQTYFDATYKMIFPFLGIEILTIIPITEKNTNRVFKYTTFMIGFIGIYYIILSESCISVTGIDEIVHYKDALLATIRRVDIPYLEFLRRLDGIFLIAWTLGIFTTITIFAYGTIFFISKWFENISFNVLSFIVLFISFIVSQIPNTIYKVEKIMEYITFIGLFSATIIPITLLIITKVKKYDKKTQ